MILHQKILLSVSKAPSVVGGSVNCLAQTTFCILSVPIAKVNDFSTRYSVLSDRNIPYHINFALMHPASG